MGRPPWSGRYPGLGSGDRGRDTEPMTGPEFAVYAAATYFVVFGAGFVLRPEFADRLGLKWTGPAGRTEVRCYYGAVSWALAGFILYLARQGLAVEALTGVLMLAGAVFTMRVIGTAIDGGWSDPYTRTAIPVEGLFVVMLGVIRFLA